MTEISTAQLPTTLGIDIGGSGIKGGIVDLSQGILVGERLKIPTPKPATPYNVIEVLKEIFNHFSWNSYLGVTVPCVTVNGVTKTATNIDSSWIDLDVSTLFHASLSQEVSVINDADAAGIAELMYGAGKHISGTVLLLTIGTGIGSALIRNNILVPNTELGKIEVQGKIAEKRAASSVKEAKNLSYSEWAKILDEILHTYEELFSPDLIIIGGGISRKSEKWLHHLTVNTPTVPAQLQNEAGIIGAAYVAAQNFEPHPEYSKSLLDNCEN